MLWPSFIIKKITKYLSFYDLVSLSLVGRQFFNAVDIEDAQSTLPFSPIKRKYLRSLTDYIMFQYLQNPSRLDNVTLNSVKRIIKKGDKKNMENSIRMYLRSFMKLEQKYKYCLGWKKYQIWLKYSYFSSDLLDELGASLEENYTWEEFLYEQRRTTEFFMLKDRDIY